jgi:hypothetical protein
VTANRFAAFAFYSAVLLCWLLPWVDYYRTEWLPRYRVQRRWDGKFMGRDGDLVQVVCPSVWDLRRRFWLTSYTVGTMYVECRVGQVHLQTVTTARGWVQGVALYEDKRKQRRLQRRH